MSTHLSAVKRTRQNTKKRWHNRKAKSMVKTAEKKVRQAPDKDQANTFLKEAHSLLDKAAAKGVLHQRTAARHKSRLAKKVHSLTSPAAKMEQDQK